MTYNNKSHKDIQSEQFQKFKENKLKNKNDFESQLAVNKVRPKFNQYAKGGGISTMTWIIIGSCIVISVIIGIVIYKFTQPKLNYDSSISNVTNETSIKSNNPNKPININIVANVEDSSTISESNSTEEIVIGG